MKTKGFFTAIILVILTSFNLFAETSNGTNLPDSIKHRINIRVNQNNEVVLRADCMKQHKWVGFVVKLYSSNGEMVFAQSFHKKGGIYKGFDMKNLPDGKYEFIVYQDLKKVYTKEVIKTSEIVSTGEGYNRMIVQEVK